jgi:hypothetical protein
MGGSARWKEGQSCFRRKEARLLPSCHPKSGRTLGGSNGRSSFHRKEKQRKKPKGKTKGKETLVHEP